MNRILIVGRLGRNPEVKVSEGRQAQANFSVATDDHYAGEVHTEWHRCVAHGSKAEFMGAYVSKGDLVEIEGRNQTRKVEHSGMTKHITEIIVSSVKQLIRKDIGALDRDIG